MMLSVDGISIFTNELFILSKLSRRTVSLGLTVDGFVVGTILPSECLADLIMVPPVIASLWCLDNHDFINGSSAATEFSLIDT